MIGLPILLGYFPVAVAFGILAKGAGVNLSDTALFSVLVFAGASQFMAINLLSTGTGAWGIIIATFLLNLRHLLMSASLAARLQINKDWKIPLLAFGVTDETFAVASTYRGSLTAPLVLIMEGTAYAGWVAGTVTGHLVGAVLPNDLSSSMGIGLYAMFIAILTPQMKKSRTVFLLAGGAGLVHFLLKTLAPDSGGWGLIIAIIAVSSLGAMFCREEGEEES